MSNDTDIVIRSDFREQFPGLAEKLEKARGLMEVESFEDLERLFLRGAGLSANTYSSYATAVRQFYDHTKGLCPAQVLPADIESFYDHLVKQGMEPKTRAVRMSGLRRFFSNVSEQVGCANPFDDMDPKLKKKLSQTGKGKKKKALSMAETQGILKMLKRDTSPAGKQRHAVCLMLYSSGLRAQEFCSLRWGNIDDIDGQLVCSFVQKGGSDATQEIPREAFDAAMKAFRSKHRRKPRADEALFSSSVDSPMDKQSLWRMLKRVERDAKAEGVLTRNDIEFSAHLWRRSSITHLVRRGVNVVAVQAFARHRSFATTSRHYADLGAEGVAQTLTGIVGIRQSTSPVMSHSSTT